MAEFNPYQALEIDPTATQAEIKQAYRRLAKACHPDCQGSFASHDRISQVNAAYEVLKDPQLRHHYDRTHPLPRSPRATSSPCDWHTSFHRHGAAPSASRHPEQSSPYPYSSYPRPSQTPHATNTIREMDHHLQIWLKQVYRPVNRKIAKMVTQLHHQIHELSADPYDDDLIQDFQDYLKDCAQTLKQAQTALRSMPNPANVAGIAAHLYFCLHRIEDGLEDLQLFTHCYDDNYLSSGQELFRIATKLSQEAQDDVQTLLSLI
ncbi:DnaJ domain-containing protein [Synechococcales cyanobacterium C]|uniref:DnaJ domain-containing protein n=1 Tax=Petrachloros mirabilis ULC683 TaxID=2781853 RepID=A0A8K1ZVY2_9CYAN|nr:DnaJ domain-containing protein [Petrachloros mirabilis]NCJ05081.1 DnaJ domain-containing protein [Petrachloros mirabilis ULC683]